MGRSRKNREAEQSLDEDVETKSERFKLKRNKKDKLKEKETSTRFPWLRQNWLTVILLLSIFLFGLFLRSYYYYEPATEDDFILSGNDPYYHKRVVDYVQEEHHHLTRDPLLSYPSGNINPRPPLFDWSIAIFGLVLAPLFGGDVYTSTWLVIEFSPAFWGALTIIPVYFIGREMFGRKEGMICAFLIATLPSHVERSPLGFSDHDAIVLFLVTTGFYFFVKGLNSLKDREEWVEKWSSPKKVWMGLKSWFQANRRSVAYSLLAGFSLAAIALTWEGFLYPIVIIVVYFFIHMVLNKIRNKNSIGIALCTIITLTVVAIVPYPYFYVMFRGQISEMFYILGATLFVSVIFVSTRKVPWILVFSTLIILIVCIFYLMIYLLPDIAQTFLSGQGYFGENKIYSTIAEAQPPDYSRLVFSYGVVTTFLALIALVILIIRVVKDLKAPYLFMTIWGVAAIYMAVTASRFVFNAGPIVAVLSGWIIWVIIEKLDFRSMRKTFRVLKGSPLHAIRRSVKIKHIAGSLFLIFMVFLPNVWTGWDAGVPFGKKKDVDVDVYETLPENIHLNWDLIGLDFWINFKPHEYNYDERGCTTLYPHGTNIMYNKTNMNELKYFGAFGHGFPSDYWLAGMEWLSEQDTDLPIEERPGFISWWDYGFWCIYLGEHPTAADNFQNAVHFAGLCISANGEDQAIPLFIARIVSAVNGLVLRGLIDDEIKRDAEEILISSVGEEAADEIFDVVQNGYDYRKVVLSDPERFGYFSSDLSHQTAPFAYLQTRIPELLNEEEQIWLLHKLEEATGFSFRYFAIDSRLFPFGPQNTGIYYAPLKLSDHRINEDFNEPYDFIQTYVYDTTGEKYTLPEWKEASKDDPNLEADRYQLTYKEPFLNSMLYKCYIGYTLEDIEASDQDTGAQTSTTPTLPGLGNTNFPPMEGWMMKHFRLVYKTTYWNPHNDTDVKFHPEDWQAMSSIEAEKMYEEEAGSISSGLNSGVIFLKYYEGAYLNGTVKTDAGKIVQNVRVTVLDEYGIPHDTTTTDENGTYHLIAPFGNVSVVVSTGGYGDDASTKPYYLMRQIETISLNTTNINISEDQAYRKKIDEDGDGIMDYNIVKDFSIESNVLEGRVYWDNDLSVSYEDGVDTNITNASISLISTEMELIYTNITREDGTYEFKDIGPGTYTLEVNVNGHTISEEEEQEFKAGDVKTMDIGIKPANVTGQLKSIYGQVFDDEEVILHDNTNMSELTIKTNLTGEYGFHRLLPGDYTLTLDIEGYKTQEINFELSQGTALDKDLVLEPSSDIIGYTIIKNSNTTISNVTIKFSGLGENADIVTTIKSNQTGFFTADLKNGAYTVYVKHDIGEELPYVYLSMIYLNGGTVDYDVPLERSVEVKGTVYADQNDNGTIEANETKGNIMLTFENEYSRFTAPTNSSGFYRMYLPSDNYSIYSSVEGDENDYACLETLSLAGIKRVDFDVELRDAQEIIGYAYYDINDNGAINTDERLANTFIIFTDDNDRSINATTANDGKYQVYLPLNRTYNIFVQKSGFQSVQRSHVDPDEAEENYNLVPINISLSGITTFNGNLIGEVPIEFEAIDDGGEDKSVTSDPGGHYTTELKPGEYEVSIDYQTNESGKPILYVHDSDITLEIGDEQKDLNLSLVKKVKVNGTVHGFSEDVEIVFEGENSASTVTDNGEFDIFVVPGTYDVRVYHEADIDEYYVYLQNHTFPESQTLDINLTIGVKVYGVTQYENDDEGEIEILFIGNGTMSIKSNIDGSYEIFLPPNATYEVNVNQSMVEDDKQVKFTFDDVLNLGMDEEEYDIDMRKFVEVKGTVYIDWNDNEKPDGGEGIDDIEITFDDSQDSIVVYTDGEGKYSTFLELERYDIYLDLDFPIEDEERNITVSMTDTDKDIPIFPLNLTVTGITYYSSLPENYTDIWFIALDNNALNHTTSSDSGGIYSVELSCGEYSVYAKKETAQRDIAYLGKISVRPRQSLSYDFGLVDGVSLQGKAYIINSSGINTTITADINFESEGLVTNTSDVQGIYKILLPPDIYTISGKYSILELGRVMNYTYQDTIDISKNLSLNLNFSKLAEYSVLIEWIEDSPVLLLPNESVDYSVRIKNTGSVKEIFDITHSGPTNWNVTIDENVTLDIGETITLNVHIQTSEDAKVEDPPVVINVVAREDPSAIDFVELEVNIVQIFKAANITAQPTGNIQGNIITYVIEVENPGNGNDDFRLVAKGIPRHWSASLSETVLTLSAGESKEITLTLNVTEEALQKRATIYIDAVSQGDVNLTSQVKIEVLLPNLEIVEDDLSIKGNGVSEGALEEVSVPGFEGVILIGALLIATFLLRRRRRK